MNKALSEIREKMEARGVMEMAIRSFERACSLITDGEGGLIPESELQPAAGVLNYEDLPQKKDFDPGLAGQTVVIKLNGGLGTSMGLEKVKSLLEVRPGVAFLDLMARQILSLRQKTGEEVRFLLMNSQATSADTQGYLRKFIPEIGDPSECELMQNWVPKLRQDNGRPVTWEAQPDLEWCPPGHGDVYPALAGSGWLDRLLADGVKYAFLSNSDNLGAVLDPSLLAHLAQSGAPFLMEVTRRTESDRKGGHLALRSADQRLILREVAQCPAEDLDAFQNIDKHQFFNTNNIWINLEAVQEVMTANDGVLPLPVILNSKSVDPRDSSSTPVIQLEQAMGSAVECFEGAQAVNVPRTRFAPVKTTADLLALRSDAYELSDDGQMRLADSRNGVPPVISLSSEYKFVDGLKELGVPSLLEARELSVTGSFFFDEDVRIEGDVSLMNEREERAILAHRVFRDEEHRIH